MRYVLGSRSPRRRELLQLLVPAALIDICPPRDAAEAGFDGLSRLSELEDRLASIAAHKAALVHADLTIEQRAGSTLIVADTSVFCETATGRWISLGQPDEAGDWQAQVRHWFLEHYAGKTHFVATAWEVHAPDRAVQRGITRTQVTMRAQIKSLIDWYLSTGESLGKAGGYALQGRASILIQRVEGSLSNVVGLPLESLAPALGLVPHP